ncbi:uncharacterized protein [Clytia hemisphaerica]|uniref:Fibrinogen C-terminal domain-containing protein n=1 Tax=Clytia hemisphaerica TaxID=252671 RepID=A0A7M6DQ06_9CNID
MTNGFECEILDQDIYVASVKLVSSSNTTHTLISSKCLSNPCKLKIGFKCIPNYMNNTYQCAPQSCKALKKDDPSLRSSFYHVFLAGKIRKVYCDMEKDGGGWMLIANYTIPSTEITQAFNYGDLDAFEELATGNFFLDSNVYLPIINAWFPINEFRCYCYKPSVGRIVDLATDPSTDLGSYINRFILGKEPKKICSPPCGLRSLPNDQSELIHQVTSIGWGITAQYLYRAPFLKGDNIHILLWRYKQRYECDDVTDQLYSDSDYYNTFYAGNWKYYIG